MQAQSGSKSEPNSREATEQVTGAHKLLKSLQGKISEHPEIGQAIDKLERALALLELETNGML